MSEDHQLLYFSDSTPENDATALALNDKSLACVQEVEKDLNMQLIRLDFSQNPGRNKKLFHVFSDRGKRCEGVPFFFNKTNGEYICGFSQCEEVRKWVAGNTEKK